MRIQVKRPCSTKTPSLNSPGRQSALAMVSHRVEGAGRRGIAPSTLVAAPMWQRLFSGRSQ
jgi:hypothetical protein